MVIAITKTIGPATANTLRLFDVFMAFLIYVLKFVIHKSAKNITQVQSSMVHGSRLTNEKYDPAAG
jgi:hypothetical protein